MSKELSDHTKAELVEMGAELGLELNERSKKEYLVAEIESALNSEVKAEPKAEEPKPSNKENDYDKHPKFAKFKKEGN